MTTETWWVLGDLINGEWHYMVPDVYEPDGVGQCYAWLPVPVDSAHRFTTRPAAEDEADGAQVVECTLTCRPVGLRWEEYADDGVTYHSLHDGGGVYPWHQAQVTQRKDGRWRISWIFRSNTGDPLMRRHWATLDEAKAAAVAAVKETWK